MTCRICCWIRSKWYKFTGVEWLLIQTNAMLDMHRKQITSDYARLVNELESNVTTFRKAVKDRFKGVDQELFNAREWADKNAEGKVSPQRERIVDLKLKVDKLGKALDGLDSEMESVGIRIGKLEHPKPEKISG